MNAPNVQVAKAAIFFHFTALHAIERIKREGLTLGMMPWMVDPSGALTFKRNFQWLTSNPNFGQPWCLNGNLPFPKNAYRITVCIPHERRGRIFNWLELCRRCSPDSAEEINKTGGDVENWAVYFGRIRPEWFLEVARNATGQIIADGALLD